MASADPHPARGADLGADAREPLWRPSRERLRDVEMARFMRWAGERRGAPFAGYEELWRWSVDELEEFWACVWEFCGVRASKPYERVLGSREMPGARWFEGAELNYAENLLCGPVPPPRREGQGERDRSGELAVLHSSELRDYRDPPAQITWGELSARVAAAAGGLRALGVRRGDRVVAYMPNIPETLIALLATASIGAIWSSAAPEFGARSVIDRFAQIEPKALLTVDGYRHGGKDFDRTAVVGRILEELPSVEHVVVLPYLADEDFDEAAFGGGVAVSSHGISCWTWTRPPRAPSWSSSRCRSTTRCGCCTRRARRACRRRSCTATAAFCWSDWIHITPRGGTVIYGRSDSMINRQGVRMGTAEIYRVALAGEEVLDALT
jgi:hypothetical protein